MCYVHLLNFNRLMHFVLVLLHFMIICILYTIFNKIITWNIRLENDFFYTQYFLQFEFLQFQFPCARTYVSKYMCIPNPIQLTSIHSLCSSIHEMQWSIAHAQIFVSFCFWNLHLIDCWNNCFDPMKIALRLQFYSKISKKYVCLQKIIFNIFNILLKSCQ